MKRTEAEIQLISSYLLDKLTEEQKIAFEERIASDSILQEDVTKLKLLAQVTERQLLREKIQQIQVAKFAEWANEETEETTTTVKVIPLRNRSLFTRKLSAVTSVASIAFVISYLSFSDVTYEPMAFSERSNNHVMNDPVLEKLNKAVSLVQHGNSHEATLLFDQIERLPNIHPYYRDAAAWYEVVALQKTGKNQQAKNLLEQIESNPRFQFNIPTIDKWKVKWKLLF